MPIDKAIQEKVLKIAANKDVADDIKVDVRKRFYEIKLKELEIESAQNEFNKVVKVFDNQLTEAIKELTKMGGSVQTVDAIPASAIKPKIQVPTEMDDDSAEEIIVPKKPTEGIRVAMQEEVDNENEESTDFEVPFEAEESEQ